MPVLFWTICQSKTRQARMNTQKIIVLTVEFTKNPLFLRFNREKGPFRTYPTGHPGKFMQHSHLLDDSNLLRIPKNCDVDCTRPNSHTHAATRFTNVYSTPCRRETSSKPA